MDGIIITAAVVLGVITLISILSYYYILPSGGKPDSLTVLPVFAGDKGFPQRLERLMLRNETQVILVDYSADAAQIELCRRFVHNYPDSAFISHEEIEKIFSETFAFYDEI